MKYKQVGGGRGEIDPPPEKVLSKSPTLLGLIFVSQNSFYAKEFWSIMRS